MEQVKSWLAGLNPKSRKQMLLGLGVIAILAGVYFSQNSQPEQSTFEGSSSSSLKISGNIFVHVVGEVRNPGLYELSVGSRVQDAISLAGGMSPEAVLESVNLARMLSDGEQILVLAKSQMAAESSAGYISLNRATSSQLESLPGVGPALASRIIDFRSKVGSFSDLAQLKDVSGIGQKLFDSISKQLTL
jgi:competence protein ComEA